MKLLRTVLFGFAATLLAFFALCAGVVLLAQLGLGWIILLSPALFVMYGWIIFAFVQYRQARQNEFVQLLTTTVDSGAPLPPAMRAYLHDRPSGPAREFWVAFILFFILPGYYWLWHRRHSYDHKVADVARRLVQGYSLYAALSANPGVVPRDTLLAVAIGENTGQLGRALRNSESLRLATIWPRLIPRLIYPLALVVVLSGIASFLMIFILPKFEKIFKDFNYSLPGPTAATFHVLRWIGDHGWLVFLAIQGLLLLIVAFFVSSTLRWVTPGVGALYRLAVQSRVLRMLGILLDTGKPVPEAIGLLAASEGFALDARRRLQTARDAVEHGQTLPNSLLAGGLIQRSMMPLLDAAQRVQNLPWVLGQLGDALLARLARLLEKLSALIFPLSVILVGLLVGYFVISVFLPLVYIISRLSQ